MFESIFDFSPVSLVRGDHRLVLKVSYHGDENTPSFYFFTYTKKRVTLSVVDFNRNKSLSHFFNLILHLVDIHLRPLELHVVIEPILTLFYVLPQLFHPSDLHFDCIYDFGTSWSLTFGEFEHRLIISEFIESTSEFFNVLFGRLYALGAGLNSSFVEVKRLSFERCIDLFEFLFKLFNVIFCLSGFNCLRTCDLLLNSGGYKVDCLCIIDKFISFFHFTLLLFIKFFFVSFKNFFDSI